MSALRSLVAKWTKRARPVAFVLLGILIWIAQVQWPMTPATPDLDPSWQQALAYALAHGMRFGHDIVFTFGPLGAMAHSRYEPGLYFWAQILLFECLLKGLIAWRWVTTLQRMPGPIGVALVVLFLVSLAYGESFWFATIVILGVDMLRREEADAPPRLRDHLLDLLLVWSSGFVKFTGFVLATGICSLVSLRAAQRSLTRGVAFLRLAVVCCFLVWTACFQRPWDLPMWVLRSAQVASGYTEAQAQDGSAADVRTGLVGALVLVAALLLFVGTSARRRPAVYVAVAVLLGAWVSFRAGFTSHGDIAYTWYVFLGLATCVIVPGAGALPRRRLALGGARFALVFLGAAGVTGWFGGSPWFVFVESGIDRVERELVVVPELLHLGIRLETERAQLAADYALPRTRAIVGSEPVDFVGNSQGWIFLNGLNWKPRPLFQSYIATTKELIDLNAEFFRGPDAPTFVLYASDPIDMRMPWMEDSAARFAMLQGYTPVTMERGLLLLRRDPARAGRQLPAGETILERDIAPDELLHLRHLPGQVVTAEIDVRYSILGSLRQALYHAPMTRIQMFSSDGQPRERRFVPGMARTQLLMRPALEFDEDWIESFTFGTGSQFESLLVTSPDEWSTWFEPKIHVTVQRCDALFPAADPDRLVELVFGSFPTRPMRIVGYPHPTYYVIGTRDVALVNSGVRIVFAASAGRRHARGAFGLLDVGIGTGSGVDFHFALVAADGSQRTLFERRLEGRDADVLRAVLDLEFEAKERDRLMITTSDPDHGDGGFKQPYLEAIEIR